MKSKAWTVGELARRFGVARSTLLYYDGLGLLSPAGRTSANYRVYDEAAVARLDAIRTYRRAGVPLSDVKRLLDAKGAPAGLLVERLRVLDLEIARCREQQRVIVEMLEGAVRLDTTRTLDKKAWVAILRAAGLDDDAMHRWHVAFEASAPAAHQDFLEALGIGTAEIARIRGWAGAESAGG